MKTVYHLTEEDIKDAIKVWMQAKQISGHFEVKLVVTSTVVTATVSQVEKDYLD